MSARWFSKGRSAAATADPIAEAAAMASGALGRALTTIRGVRSPTRSEAERLAAAEGAEEIAPPRRRRIEDVAAEAEAAMARLGGG